MKKSDFKIDFSKRDVIFCVCFTIVMILVLILGNTFGYVSADDNISQDQEYFNPEISGADDFMSFTGFLSSSIYDSSMPTAQNFFPTRSNNYNNEIYDSFIQFFPSHISSSYSNYLVLDGNELTSTGQVMTVVCFDDSTFPTIDSGLRLWAFESGHKFDLYKFTFSNDNWALSSYSIDNNINKFDNDYQNVGFYTRAVSDIASGSYPGNRLCLGNVQVFAYNTNSDGSFSSLWNILWYLNGYLSGNSYQDRFFPINYYLSDGLIGGTGSIGGETDSNNMYLNNCKFTFSFNRYVDSVTNDTLTYRNNWGGGYINFSAMLNNYQYENIDKFSLQFQFQVLVKGKGTLHQEDNDSYPTETVKDFYGNFYYTESCDLLDLSNGTIAWRLSDITNSFEDSSAVINGTNITKLDRFIANMTEYVSIDWSYFKLYCTAKLVSDDVGTSETYRTDSYNFVTGSSTVVSDGLDTNLNPYYDSENDSVSGDDDHIESNSSSTTTSTGYGTVTQNNNQTVTVNTGSSGSSDTVEKVEQILAGVDSGEDIDSVSWVSTFSDLVGTNAFIVLMTTTFSFIPVNVWTSLATFFVVCLGFLTAFVLLRMLLDLL